MIPLRVVAVASSQETKDALSKQLDELEYVHCTEVALNLSDAQQLWETQKPDLLIIDLTGQELDACLFIEVINFNVENKTTVFGLHKELDPNIILKAVSSGVKEFVQYPKDSDALEQALEKYWNYHKKVVQSRIDSGELVKKAQLIPVFSSKGGSGGTTVAINLAYKLIDSANKSVVFIDMDQVFSNATAYLNFKPTFSLGDLGEDKPSDIDDQVLEKIIVEHEETGLHMMVACKSVMDEHPMMTIEHIQRVLTYLSARYDYIIVDLPTHTVDEYHQFFVEQADSVILVSSMDLLALYKTRQYLELVQNHLDVTKFKLIINRYDLKAVVGMSPKNLEEQFKYPIYHRLPNSWGHHVEAMSLGKPVSITQPKSDMAKAFHDLVVMLTGIEEETEDGSPLMNVAGIFEKFAGKKSNVSG